jgi:hypothetical protein
VTVDDKDLVAIHSLTQLAVRGQTDKGDRRGIAAAVARALKQRLAKFDHQKPSLSAAGTLPTHVPPRRTLPWGAHPGTPGSCIAGRGTSGSRSGRGWWRRGAGRDEFAGRRAGNVHVGGGFLSVCGRTVSAGVGHV